MKALFYMAHPVAADEHYTTEQNLDHALRVARTLWDCDLRIILPWHTHCLFLDDTNEEHRAAGLEVDIAMVQFCQAIILTGHRISSGMEKEMVAAARHNRLCLNLTGISRDKIPGCVERWRRAVHVTHPHLRATI